MLAQIEVATDLAEYEEDMEGHSEDHLEGLEGQEGGEDALEGVEAEVEAEAGEEQEAEEQPDDEVEDEEKKKKGGRAKKLTNQFNFSERAALTYNMPSRVSKDISFPTTECYSNTRQCQRVSKSMYMLY